MAIPKLALIPSTVGGSVYSVLPSNGNGDFDFTRASAATRINAQGLIETVAVGDNRLNYPLIDGVVSGCPSLLLEPERINLITYSEAFDNAAWTKSGASITSNAAISPDGTQTADLITNISSNGYAAYTASFDADLEYTFSVFVKAGTSNLFSLVYTPFMSQVISVEFDLSSETATVNAGTPTNFGIDNFGNGWFRIFITEPKNATTGTSFVRVVLSGSTSDTGYIWGAQVEQGSYPTSYIPTSGTTATRSAETCNNAGDVNTFNDSEGVLFAEIKWLDESGAYRGISVSDGLSNDNNRIQINFNQNTGNLVLNVTVGGVHQAVYSSTIFPSNFSKVGIKYKENDFAFWVNGIEIYTDNLGITYPANTLSELKFNSPLGAVPFYGNIKQIQYFDTALNDSDLETLTSWVSFSDMANGQQYTIE
jgi:hypothetical protein